jgi:hypothetical protein
MLVGLHSRFRADPRVRDSLRGEHFPIRSQGRFDHFNIIELVSELVVTRQAIRCTSQMHIHKPRYYLAT